MSSFVGSRKERCSVEDRSSAGQFRRITTYLYLVLSFAVFVCQLCHGRSVSFLEIILGSIMSSVHCSSDGTSVPLVTRMGNVYMCRQLR